MVAKVARAFQSRADMWQPVKNKVELFFISPFYEQK
jgi:hypothetical protein